MAAVVVEGDFVLLSAHSDTGARTQPVSQHRQRERQQPTSLQLGRGGIKTAYYRDLINTSARQFVKRVIVFSFYSFLKKKKQFVVSFVLLEVFFGGEF